MHLQPRHVGPFEYIAAMVCLCIALHSGLVFADSMVHRGQTLDNIVIAGYSQGMIEFRTSQGDFEKFSILDIESFEVDSIDGMANLNAAEAYLLQERPRKAVERYEKALRRAKGFWGPLVQARLVMAADEALLFEKAARAWLKIAHRDEVTAALLLPRFLPDKPSTSTRRVIKKLERTIDRSSSLKEKALAEMLRFETLRRLNDPAAKVLAAPLIKLAIKAELLGARTTDVIVRAGELLIESGSASKIQALIDGAIAEAPENSLPSLLLLKSRAVYANSQTPEEYLSAALPAMRVVIHFPKHPLAGDGLLLAAKAHHASGKTQAARKLLDACMQLAHLTPETKLQAAKLLKVVSNDSKHTETSEHTKGETS